MPNLHQKIPRAPLPGAPLPKAQLPTPKGMPGEGDRERVSPEIRARVWKKRFGFRSTGTCVCCHETTIRRDDFACGHRRTYAGGGSDVSNLEPICDRCYRKMGTHDLVSWCRKFEEELRKVKPMAKTVAKKTVRKTTAKKPARKAAAKKKPAAKKAKR